MDGADAEAVFGAVREARRENLASAVRRALDDALTEQDDVVMLGEDIGRLGGVFRVTEGLLERHGEGRVIDTPICESGFTGAAVGLAIAGMRPVVEIQFGGFLYPAHDQLRSHAARIRTRTRGQLTAPMVVRAPYGSGVGAPESHCDTVEMLAARTPGLSVVVPSTLAALRQRDVARVTVRTMATNYAALGVLRRIGWKATATSTLMSRWLTALVALLLAGALQLGGAASADALEIVVGHPYGNHTIGHTAVRVRTFDADKEVVYDFGRYGKTWGKFGFHGEGIMRVRHGERAVKRYFDKQQGFRDSVGYVIRMTEAEERRVLRHYEDMLKTAKWRKKYRLHTRYRLARDHHGVHNQCTSMSLEGMKTHWPRERREKLLDPRYNQGQGFTVAVKRYFKATQRELGLNETVVPLDVIDAFEAARKAGNKDILAVNHYPRR